MSDKLVITNVTSACQISQQFGCSPSMESSIFTHSINGIIDKSSHHQTETLKIGQKDNILTNKIDDNINVKIKNEPEDVIIIDYQKSDDQKTKKTPPFIVGQQRSKRRMRKFISYEEKKRVVDLARDNPGWTLDELKKQSGCNSINNFHQLRHWADQVEKNSKPLDEKLQVHQWVYNKCIEHKNNNLSLTNDIILEWANQAKVKFLSQNSNIPATSGWLKNFHHKFGITGNPNDLQFSNNIRYDKQKFRQSTSNKISIDKNNIEIKKNDNNDKLINNNNIIKKTIKIDNKYEISKQNYAKRKKRFIAYEEKKKIVEIVKKNPTWTIGEIRKYTGCDFLNSTHQLRQWADQVARNYKPWDEKKKVHSWVYKRYIDYKKKNIEITDKLLLEWANDAKKIFLSKFSNVPASAIWLRNFKKKYGIVGNDLLTFDHYIDKVDGKEETITIDSDNDHEEIKETIEEVKMDIEQPPFVTLKVPIKFMENSINQIDNTTPVSNDKIPIINNMNRNGIVKRKVGRPKKSERISKPIIIKQKQNECKQRKFINYEMKKNIVRYFREHPTLSLDELKKGTGCDGITSYIQIRNWATILKKQDKTKKDKQKIYNKIYARCIKQIKNNTKLSDNLILGWAKYAIQRAAIKNSRLTKFSLSSMWLHKFKKTFNISGDPNNLKLYILNDEYTNKKPNNILTNDNYNKKTIINNDNDDIECSKKIISDDMKNEKLLQVQNWVYERCVEYEKNNLLISMETIMVWANEAKKIYLSNCQAFDTCNSPTTKKWIQDFINIYGITGKPCNLEINYFNHQQKLNNGYKVIDIAGNSHDNNHPENELITKIKQEKEPMEEEKEKEEEINEQPMKIEIISFGSLSSGEVIYPSNFKQMNN
ncbi:hypothetical protein HCN44_003231 [Aphidius gifuensis]|uniref:HTH CENPB-type domain-containing protein n=1 Tax=Aphidius gifuensis TaxID=684658 RepID=A0A835CLL7_APHGI|nr:uncharacterized protein LOC122859097 [Aphidius gifuensis]KAF7987469.1 hypothetical protein HCN44_003231 [Aphidius gifuensis]